MRDRIDPTGMKRVTSDNSPEGKRTALDHTMQPQRLDLPHLRRHQHRGKADQAANRQRERQRLVTAAGAADGGALGGFIDVLVVDPFQTVAAQVMTQVFQGVRQLGVALQGGRDAEHRQVQVLTLKGADAEPAATQLVARATSGQQAQFIWWVRAGRAYQLAIYSNRDAIPKGVIQNLMEGIELP